MTRIRITGNPDNPDSPANPANPASPASPARPEPGPSRSRRRLGAAGVVLSAAVLLAACGSSGSGSGNSTSTSGASTTTSPSGSSVTNPTAVLASLETPPSAKVALSEDGSSLLYPLYQQWVAAFSAMHSNVTSSAGNDGSGTGISDAESGTVDIGASDAYLPPATMSQYPTLEDIPVAISAQVVAYNLPGMAGKHLKLDGSVLDGMYDGTIKSWNDSAVKALNPGVTLPDIPVVPVHRSDSSGDTFLFTSYLADSDSSGWAAKGSGPSPSATFPSVAGAIAEKGNSGMVKGCGATKGCVAYIGISYLSDIASAGLGYAELQNKRGNYELPTPATVHAEASSFTSIPANGAISLIYGPASDGYPIINFEYLVVKTNQSDANTAKAMKALIAWEMDPTGGNASKYLSPVHFQPLPTNALKVAVGLLKKIS